MGKYYPREFLLQTLYTYAVQATIIPARDQEEPIASDSVNFNQFIGQNILPEIRLFSA
jgi:hypothetical protein